MNKAKVVVLQAGYAKWENSKKAQKADGTITLIRSDKNVIVDTGLPKDKEIIISSLKNNQLSVEDIDFVVCTHGDADHIGNVNLFPKAKLVVGFDIYDGDLATFFQKNYIIDPNITATEMIGHDDRSIGILVTTDRGIVAITGDLFEYENDYKKVNEWLSFSKKPKEHIKTRARVWELADYIVPGHGPIFRVDKSVDILSIEKIQLDELLKTNSNVYGDIEA